MSKERQGYIGQENGKWFARVTFTDSFTGKRRNIKRIVKTEAKAKQLLKELLKKLEGQGEKVFDIEKLTFINLADYYEKHFCQPAEIVNGSKVSGLRSYEDAQRAVKRFRDFFGDKLLRLITHGDLVSYRRMRMKLPTHQSEVRAVGTMNRELSIMRRMFSVAVSQQWLNRNPFNCGDAIIHPSSEGVRKAILSIDEEKRLLEALNEPCRVHIKPLVICLLDSGARTGEMLKLTWQFVDFEKRLITFRSETTKTFTTRQIAMTKRMYEELNSLWGKSDKNLPDKVFTMKIFRVAFYTACRIAGIKTGGNDGLTVHGLRHTAATRLVQGKMPIQIVGKILGHKDIQSTYRYLSANDETLKQAASILESIQSPTDNDF